jgi:hypothetical protein
MQKNEKFLEAVKTLETYRIDINDNGLDLLCRELNAYQSDRNNPQYPLELVLRELGRMAPSGPNRIEEPLSKNVTTVVYERYFSESATQTLATILQELDRISQNRFGFKILNESQYNEETGDTSVTIEFEVSGRRITLTHEDDYEDGTLLEGFFTGKLIPVLKDNLKDGYMLYTSELSVTFVYFDNPASYEGFKKSFPGYSDIR